MRASAISSLLSAPTALANLISLPRGPFSVNWTVSELVDNDRVDPFNATHFRRLMVTQFTPVQRCKCKNVCRLPYMPAEVARIEDEILEDYLGDVGWPAGVLATLEIEACCELRNEASSDVAKFPTVFLGSGLNTTRLFYTATAQHFASMGNVVYTVDHPYETDVVQFLNGDIIFGGRVAANRQNPNDTTSLEFGLDVRTQDISFILDTLKVDRAVYIGHSFGGASAAAAVLAEDRLAGGVNLDGTLWGPVQHKGVHRPFLTFGSEGHNSSADSELSWDNFFAAMEANHPDVWSKEISINGSVHNSYWDMPVIGDVTGLSENEELADLFFGSVRGDRIMKIIREYLGDFVDFALGGEEGLLAGPSSDYPDVQFIR
ncbi:putative 1-alkyl-2-acetylglycerophosphocholine esterase [Paramyrothecium foliicola]|nr:putative 1-alkyl-2-acetylglycerophosphocholine esterase [Paramyrothecium foliicola]